MTRSDPKADLHRYLQEARDALLWKLDGLTEYDIRRRRGRPGRTRPGRANNLGPAGQGYFGDTFGSPPEDKIPWDETDPNSDMFAAPEESRAFITGLYRRACAHSDATIDALALDATGHVPWWPADGNEGTLHHILIRLGAETNRHAGQADVVRELIDGTAGLSVEASNLPSEDPAWWAAHRDRVERAAQQAAAASTDPGGQRD